jgi:c-di-GMP-binding flagellar brake protein YcgR
MKLNDLIPGIKLELELYNKDGDVIMPAFVSEFEWAENEYTAVIAAPIREGIIYPVPVGSHMEIFFAFKYEEPNRIEMYKFKAKVIRRKTVDNIALLDIEQASEIEKIQRRQFFRFDCSIPIRYRQVISLNKEQNEGIPFKKAYTRDLSAGGLCFKTEEKLEMDKTLEVEIFLEENLVKTFYGTIVRVSKLEGLERNFYEIGIWFKKVESKEREAIVKFIFIEQRKLIKKGLI